MKKILSIILVLALMLGGCVVQVSAASSYTDITDTATANAVEVLTLMGVIDGVGNGKYNPSGTLNRAQFAKLAVAALNSEAQLSLYKHITIYPDVKASEWFAPYVNIAAKEMKIIAGLPDGMFHPERTISVGEAVTILIRLIGYEDSQVSGVWPYGHFDFAKDLGMLTGINVSTPSQSISRGDAAKLFVNTINASAANATGVFTLSSETVLISVNAGTKTMKTRDASYTMLKSISSTGLVGRAGYVVFKGGKAVTFIPKSAIAGGYETVMILKSASDTASLTALAGRSDYKIYKNGALVTADKLRSGDVITYDAGSNSILACDTKIGVYYKACTGSPTEPESITVTGGTSGVELSVLPCAIATLKNFRPGSFMSVSLAPNGQVAAVGSYTSTSNNGIFVVDENGNANLVCGGGLIDLGFTVSNTSLYGKAAQISSADANKVNFVEADNTLYGKLDVTNGKLGTTKIASNALVFENGVVTSLAQLTTTDVKYARTNANGEVDLIVCYSLYAGDIVVGKGEMGVETVDDGIFESYTQAALKFTTANGSVFVNTYDSTETGYYIASYAQGKLGNARKLKNTMSVAKTAFSGSVVTVNGTAYSIYKDVKCYSTTLGWKTLDEALAYGSIFTPYYLDGVVYLVTFNY